MRRKHAWTSLPDDKLLKLRLRDLKLTIEDTWLEGCLDDLQEELEERDLRIRPHAWLSDEWFSPDTTPGIAIPFYLAHPRLMRLERKMIIDVEGGTRHECMRILRHETGHVVQNAFRLQRRRRWQELFGRSSTHYPRFYRPNPASKNYVQHLRLWYAQSHPDEDFAETFAVWLKPRSDWRKRYAGWPALRKLEYVDEVMNEIAGQRSQLPRGAAVHPLSQIDTTLAAHYRKKQAFYAVNTPRTYDPELHRIFSADQKHRTSPTAASFIRRHRSYFRQTVARWTGEYQLTLDSLLDDMIDRCRELKLRAPGPERQMLTDFTVLLTAKTVHSLYSPSRRQWFAL